MSEYDVAIVGAGFAGSTLAERLARGGLSVVLLEAGPRLNDRQSHLNQFYRAAAKVPGSPWPQKNKYARSPGVLDVGSGDWKDGDKHYLHQHGPLPFGSTYERLGGGTGNHWQGATPRLVPNDFQLEDVYGAPEGAPNWPISYDDLEPWYCRAEHYIGVSGDHETWDGELGAHRSDPFPMQEIPLTYMDKVLKRRVDGKELGGVEVKVLAHPQARNSVGRDGRPPCMGNANCIPMCPILAKYDPTVHLERSAQVPGTPAEIRYQSVAHRVEVGGNDEVVAIHYKQWDTEDRVTDGVVRARRYVLAANAIETAKLLLMSPWTTRGGRDVSVANSSGQVGRNLMDHVIHLAWGLFDEPVHPFRGPNSTSRINEFRDGDERNERAAWIMGISNGGWGWPDGAPMSTVAKIVRERGLYGEPLRREVAHHVGRQVHFTAEMEQLPSAYNRITLSQHRDALGLPKPAVHWRISPYTLRSFVRAKGVFEDLFKVIGNEYTFAKSFFPSYFQFGGHEFNTHGAGHIMGTTRMGADGGSSVVDANLCSHDHSNLYVVGAGPFPTVGTANPTLTACALALRAAEHIASEFNVGLPPISKSTIRADRAANGATRA